MRSYAVLIGAGFLKRKLGSQRQPMTADHVKAFVAAIREQEHLKDLNLHRVYFYDGPTTGQYSREAAPGRETELRQYALGTG